VAATTLSALLGKMCAALRHGSTHYMFHSDAAERCKSLAVTLEAAIMLCQRDLYALPLPSCGLR
jgi:hypothetical protein